MIEGTAPVCAVASAVLSLHADVTLRQVLSVTFGLAFLALGTAITAIAYRGYRRNQSRPMLFIAIGFGLIVAPQALAAVLIYVVDVDVGELALGSTIQLFQLLGMASILYALRMDA